MSVAEGSGTPKSRGAGSGNPKAPKGAKPVGSYGRDGRRRAALARTVGAAGLAELPARQAEARPRTVPASPQGNRPDVVPVRRPLTAWAGVPQGTRPAVHRRRARVMAPAARHARPPATAHGGPAGRPRAASIGAALAPRRAAAPPRAVRIGAGGPPRATNLGATAAPRVARTGAAGPRRAARPGTAVPRRAVSITVTPGPQTTAGCGHPLAVRPVAVRQAKAPVAGPHRAAGLAGQRREASVVTLRRVPAPAPPGGQTTPGHVGPPQVTQGEARGQRANDRPPVMAAVTVHLVAVTVHRGQPAAGQATAVQATAVQASGTRHTRARHRPAVMSRPSSLGRTYLIRSAPSSSTRKRGLS